VMLVCSPHNFLTIMTSWRCASSGSLRSPPFPKGAERVPHFLLETRGCIRAWLQPASAVPTRTEEGGGFSRCAGRVIRG
jgi:hypothetical protein